MTPLAHLLLFLIAAQAPASPRPFEVVHGLDETAFHEWYDRIKEKRRIEFLDGFSSGVARFNAVAVPNNPRLAWEFQLGRTAADVEAKNNELVRKGFHARSVAGYPEGKQTRFVAVWIQDVAPQSASLHLDITAKEYQTLLKEAIERSEHPTFVRNYPTAAGARFAAGFQSGPAERYETRADFSGANFQKTLDEFGGRGFRPVALSGSRVGAATRFAATFVQDQGVEWQGRHNLTNDGLDVENDRWTGKGWRPLVVCGYTVGREPKYAALWTKGSPRRAELATTGAVIPQLQPFDDAMQRFMLERDVSAGALTVARGGKILLSRGYGFLDRARTRKTPPDAIFRIASLTKPITAAAVRKLATDGKLDLNASVFDYLALQPPPGKTMDPRWRSITIQHLLDHRGGWDREEAFDPLFRTLDITKELSLSAPATAGDVIRYMLGEPLQFDPGERFCYSNFGYCLLGRVVEKASGEGYIDYIQKAILAPLGATSVALGRSLPRLRNAREPFYNDPGVSPNALVPGDPVPTPAPDGGFHLEAMDSYAGLIASAPDLCKFLHEYWISGAPRNGDGATLRHYGSLPGTWTLAYQRNDGIDVVALFNQRSDPSGSAYEGMEQVFDAAANAVTNWPTTEK